MQNFFWRLGAKLSPLIVLSLTSSLAAVAEQPNGLSKFTLTGELEHFTRSDIARPSSIAKEVRKFDLDLCKSESTKSQHIYDDTLDPNYFIGIPYIVDLGTGYDGPPDRADALNSLSTSLSTIADTKKTLTELKLQDSGRQKTALDRLDALALEQAEAAAFNTESSGSGIPNKYLLALNYNIPALRRGWPLGHNYDAVVLSAHIFIRKPDETNQNNSKSDAVSNTAENKEKWRNNSARFRSDECISKTTAESDEPENRFGKINVMSIYPTTQVLTANLVNSRSLALQASGGYMGASGSVTYTMASQETYDENLPKLIGEADSEGHVQWVCYPAKKQEIAFGNRTAFIIFTLPTNAAPIDSIQIDTSLEYRMKGIDYLHGPVRRVQRIQLPLEQAIRGERSIAMFLRTFGRSLPVEDEMQLQRFLLAADPADLFKSKSADSNTDNHSKDVTIAVKTGTNDQGSTDKAPDSVKSPLLTPSDTSPPSNPVPSKPLPAQQKHSSAPFGGWDPSSHTPVAMLSKISNLEKSVYGKPNTKLSIGTRVSKLESSVFGNPKTGNFNIRVEQLYKNIAPNSPK